MSANPLRISQESLNLDDIISDLNAKSKPPGMAKKAKEEQKRPIVAKKAKLYSREKNLNKENVSLNKENLSSIQNESTKQETIESTTAS